MNSNPFNIKDSNYGYEIKNVTINGLPITNPNVNPETKFHIQHILYSNEIADLTDEFLSKHFVEYVGQIPSLDKFPTDKIICLDNNYNNNFEQFRVLFRFNHEDYYFTYLLRINNTYFKPTNYDEPILNYLLNKIYNDNNVFLHELCKKHQHSSFQTYRSVNIKKKVEDHKVVNLLTPENYIFDETIGGSIKINCDCCKGSHVENINPNSYIKSTTARYVYNGKHNNHPFVTEYVDSSQRNLFSISKQISENNDSNAYVSNDKPDNNSTYVFIKCSSDFVRNEITFDFTKSTVRILFNDFFKYQQNKNLFCSGVTVELHRGLFFEHGKVYSDATFYYPDWVDDRTIWTAKSDQICVQGKSVTDYTSESSNPINLSTNKYAIRLFELYDILLNIFKINLNLGNVDHTNDLVKYNQLVNLTDLHSQFVEVFEHQQMSLILTELNEYLDMLDITDIIDNKTTLDNAKYLNYSKYYHSNKYQKTSPHVFIATRIHRGRNNLKIYTMYTIVDQIYLSHTHTNLEILTNLITKQWPEREIVLIDDNKNDNDDLVEKPYNYEEYMATELLKYDHLEMQFNQNIIKKFTKLKSNNAILNLHPNKKQMLNNLLSTIN